MTQLSNGQGKARKRHRVLPITLADLARATGLNRSSVTRAFQGRLRHARLPGGRVDANHPDVGKWALSHGVDPVLLLDPVTRPRPALVLHERAMAVSDFAELAGSSAADVADALKGSGAVVPTGHVTGEDFAWRAGVELPEVVGAVHDGPLQPALQKSGRIDLGHPASLEFMAAHPYAKDRNGDLIGCDGHLADAFVGDELVINHPVARVVVARTLGRVPTDADLERLKEQD